MPSKQQKRADKAEQREVEKHQQQQIFQEEGSWEKGTNKRSLLKNQQQNEKQEEKMRNAKEMNELLITEEESLGQCKKSKSGKKKGDDVKLLHLLATMPKSKAQKDKEDKMRKKEEQRMLEEGRRKKKEESMQKQDEEDKKLLNKNIVNNDILLTNIDNNHTEYVNSIDEAINMFDSNEDEVSNNGFKEFYKTQFQIFKEQNPGLRLNQYKERIYKMWKKSDENPYNNK